MAWWRKLALVVVLGLGTLGLAACDNDGPAEQTGEKVDNAIERAGDAINPQGPAERAGEAVDDATERAGEALGNAGDRPAQ
jgi:hypothetical protein